jgi:DNA repair protein RadC
MRVNIYELELKKVKGVNIEIEQEIIRTPEIAYEIVEKVFNLSSKAHEHFGILCLSTKNKVIGAHVISIGSLNSTIVNPREVFKSAILNNSSSIVLFHNHPSGDPTPSKEDIEITKRLYDVGELLNVDVLDHIVVGEYGYVSLKEQGLM